MKKKSYPVYPPPIPILADYYHPPEGAKKALEKNNSITSAAKKAPSYSPPVPSLADYYHPNISESLLGNSKSTKKTKNSPKSKKSKKNK